jgi:hypothetical protein
MSTQEIIAELMKLRPEERLLVKKTIEELSSRSERPQETVWEVLASFAGRAENLPSDFANNHDHYLYGQGETQP